MRSNIIDADEIIVNGALISSLIKSNHIRVTGVMKSSTLNTLTFYARGLVDVREIEAEETHIHGRINSYKISSRTIVLNVSGVSRADEIEAEKLVIKSIMQHGVRGRLLAKKVYAVKAYSEFLVADLYVCCQCAMGDFNRISRFMYGRIISVSPTTSFNEKPLDIPDLCEARNRDELRFVVPA